MQIIGIHWDPPYFRLACIRSHRGHAEIVQLHSDVKLLYKSDFRGKIVTGLPGKDLLIRHTTLNVNGLRLAEQALKFQFDVSTHLPQEEILSASIFFENKKERTTEAISITAFRAAIRSHLQFYSSLEIEPGRVGAAPQALLHYVLWKHPALQTGCCIDLGSSEWSSIWIEEGKLKKSSSLVGGIEELLQCLWEDRKKTLLQKEVEGIGQQIDLLQLKPHLNPHLYEKLLEKRREISRVIYAFSKGAPCPIVFTGRTDAFVHLREFLLENVQEPSYFEKDLSGPEEEHKYAISIGLALEEAISKQEPVQFLQEEFFPKKNWKKAGVFLVILLFCSLGASSALFFWNQHSYRQKTNEMVHSIEQILSRQDPELRAEFMGKKLSAEAMLDEWGSSLEKTANLPHYTLSIPKVSHVLHWLSKHPLLKAFAESGDPFEWKEIRYRLSPTPKIGKSDCKLQVEITFSVSQSTHARKFHEALLKGDDLVDAKQPIGWETTNQGYKASFFLKQGKFHDV